MRKGKHHRNLIEQKVGSRWFLWFFLHSPMNIFGLSFPSDHRFFSIEIARPSRFGKKIKSTPLGHFHKVVLMGPQFLPSILIFKSPSEGVDIFSPYNSHLADLLPPTSLLPYPRSSIFGTPFPVDLIKLATSFHLIWISRKPLAFLNDGLHLRLIKLILSSVH